MKDNLNLKIYKKNINNKSKLVPLITKNNDTGKVRYSPPYFNEWNNTAYFYNKDTVKNMSNNTYIINKIIKSYFNLFFLYYKPNNIRKRHINIKTRRSFLKSIYISNVNIKYTNAIAILTLYTVNTRKYLLTKYSNYFNYYSNSREQNKIVSKEGKLLIRKDRFALTKIFKMIFKRYTSLLKNHRELFNKNYLENSNNITNLKELLGYKFKLLNKSFESYNLHRKSKIIKEIRKSYSKYIKLLYKYNYKYFINNFKFKEGNTSFITKLKSKLSIILNKKVELNIINLKSITYNPDIFTKALATKLKKRKFNVIKSMITIINKGKILTKDSLEKISLLKNKDLELLENKYKDLSLISMINRNNFNDLLKSIYSNKDQTKIHNIIFDSIKYKNMGGIRLEVKGRLTKRYRADRAIYKLNWKGGLKNTDSSFWGLSSTTFRGNLKPNVLYSISKSKRRIGSFAVKGWISGK